MMIYLKHELHGKKIAYLQAEAELDKAAGWVEYDPEETAKIEPEAIQEPEEKESNGYLDMDEIKAILDKAEIPYRKNASREVLMNKLESIDGHSDAN